MGWRRLLLPVAVLCALAAMSPAASGRGYNATISVRLVDEGVTGAWRSMRVEVTGSCGSDAPAGTTMTLSAALLARWSDATRAPYEPNSRYVSEDDHNPDSSGAELPDGSTAVYRFRVTGAVRAVGSGTISCEPPANFQPTYDEQTGTLSDVPDATERKALSAESFQAPPRLGAIQPFKTSASSRAGRRVPPCAHPRDQIRRWARWVAIDPGFEVDIDPRGVFGRSILPPDQLPRIRLHAAGAGAVARHESPSRSYYSQEHMFLFGAKTIHGIPSPYVIPTRTGKLRLWASLDGVDSNVISIPVVNCPGVLRQERGSSFGIY